jgi:hypothetical protein
VARHLSSLQKNLQRAPFVSALHQETAPFDCSARGDQLVLLILSDTKRRSAYSKSTYPTDCSIEGPLIQYKEDITTEITYGTDTKGMPTPRINKNIEHRNEADIQIPLTESTGSLHPDDGRPRATGNVDESSDHHAVKLRSSLSKAPLIVDPVVKREQLSNYQ